MILFNETGGYTLELYFYFHPEINYSNRAYYGTPLVLRYAIFVAEITCVKFIVLDFYYILTFLVEF